LKVSFLIYQFLKKNQEKIPFLISSPSYLLPLLFISSPFLPLSEGEIWRGRIKVGVVSSPSLRGEIKRGEVFLFSLIL
jgi:hypothetical protein